MRGWWGIVFLGLLRLSQAAEQLQCDYMMASDPVARAELVKLHTEEFLEHSKSVTQGIPDEERRFELAFSLAQNEPEVLIRRIGRFQLSSSHRLEVARQIAKKNPDIVLRHVRRLNLNSQELSVLLRAMAMDSETMRREPVAESFFQRTSTLGLSDNQKYNIVMAYWAGLRKGGVYGHFNPKAIKHLKLGPTSAKRLFDFIAEHTFRHSVELLLDSSIAKKLQYELLLAQLNRPEGPNNSHSFYEFSKALVSNIHRFGFSRAQRLELARTYLQKHFGIDTVKGLHSFELSEVETFRFIQDAFEQSTDWFAQIEKIFSAPTVDFANQKLRLALIEHICQLCREEGDVYLGSGELRDYIQNSKFSESTLVRIVEQALPLNTFYQFEHFAALKIKNARNRFRAASGWMAHGNVKELTEAQLSELLRTIPTYRRQLLAAYAQSQGEPMPNLIRSLPKNSQVEILQIHAEHHPQSVLEAIGSLALTEPQRFAVARAIALADGQIINENIAFLRLSARHRYELARITMREPYHETRNGNIALIGNFELPKSEWVVQVALEHMSHNPETPITLVANAFRLNAEQTRRLHRVAFSRNPIGYLDHLVPGLSSSSPVDAPGAIAHYTSALREYAKRYPDVLPKEWIALLWDRVQRQESGFRLLRYLYERSQYDIERPIPENSLSLISEATGLSISPEQANKMSSQRLGMFYELALDIRANLEKAPFENIPIDPRLLGKNLGELNELLLRARDLLHLTGNDQHAWNQIRSRLEAGVTRENVKEHMGELEKLVVARIEELFQGGDIKLTYQQLRELEERWAGIEPLITLISRYQGNPSWQKEIPILGQIFEAILQNKFRQARYKGFADNEKDIAAVRKQLGVLEDSPERLQAWMQMRNRLDVYDPSQGKTRTPEQRLAQAKDEVAQLHNNLKWGETPEVSPELSQKILSFTEKKQDPGKTLEEIREHLFKGENETATYRTILKVLSQRLRESNTEAELKRLVRHLNSWSSQLGLSQQTRNDLLGLSATLRPDATEGQRSFVFTTTFDDPKTLATVGDLVQCSSCQNYKTGNFIELLPGYMLDAHTLGVASFVIERGHFKIPAEFDLLMRAHGQNVGILPSYNGDRRTATFRFELDGQSHTLTTRYLGHAHLRHLIRLGETQGGEAGLSMERAYAQSHNARTLMDEQVESIFKQTAKETGATTDREITVAPSRNFPNGVYSDAAGGAQRGEFTMPPVQ